MVGERSLNTISMWANKITPAASPQLNQLQVSTICFINFLACVAGVWCDICRANKSIIYQISSRNTINLRVIINCLFKRMQFYPITFCCTFFFSVGSHIYICLILINCGHCSHLLYKFIVAIIFATHKNVWNRKENETPVNFNISLSKTVSELKYHFHTIEKCYMFKL